MSGKKEKARDKSKVHKLSLKGKHKFIKDIHGMLTMRRFFKAYCRICASQILKDMCRRTTECFSCSLSIQLIPYCKCLLKTCFDSATNDLQVPAWRIPSGRLYSVCIPGKFRFLLALTNDVSTVLRNMDSTCLVRRKGCASDLSS